MDPIALGGVTPLRSQSNCSAFPLQSLLHRELVLRSSTTVVYCAIDSLISAPNNALTGFPEFLEALSEADIPCVWTTSRNRMHLDASIRKLGHAAPFIAESGSGVYIPEDYFHLKPARTTRLGRFTCIPVASPQPAAEDALDLLAEESGVSVVPLRMLSPRELSQNVGLPQREAELLRQRDFDELFFFAGATDGDIQKFGEEAARRNLTLHSRGVVWSLAVGANLARCVRDLSKLYDRAMRSNAFTIAVGTYQDAGELFPTCNRALLLMDHSTPAEDASPPNRSGFKSIPLFSEQTWETALEVIQNRRH
jgi:mannosyl-3-phosphoglycerate phosphatase